MRWGLAGGSDIAATRMIPAMRALGQPVSAVASSSLERAEAFAATHSIPAAVADVQHLVAREDVDAVYISTVNRLHGRAHPARRRGGQARAVREAGRDGPR